MAKYAVLVTGSRSFTNYHEMKYRITRYPQDTLFIHGGADGADTICHEIIQEVSEMAGYRECEVPYFKYMRKAGGPARNVVMVEILCGLAQLGYQVSMEAFPMPDSRGTINCMKEAKKRNIPIHDWSVDGRDEPAHR